MSEAAEMFNAMNLEAKARRADNLTASTSMLINAGVDFTAHNNGVHLKVRHPNGPLVDFWPSTGLWIVQGSKAKHRGVRNLLNFLGFSNPPQGTP